MPSPEQVAFLDPRKRASTLRGLVGCEMLAIRYIASTIEAIARGMHQVHPDRLNPIMQRMADQVEHIAQYAIEGLPDSERAAALQRDLDSLKAFLVGARKDQRWQLMGNLASLEDIDQLQAAISHHTLERSPT